MRVAAIILASLLSIASASAQAPENFRASVIWAGTYRAEVVGFTPQPQTATGKTNQLANIQKLETTTTVRARLGVSFGFEFMLSGTSELAEGSVKMVVVLPKPGLNNPATQKQITREEWRPSMWRAGEVVFAGYTLEQSWEVLPGLWTFEIWQDNHKLGEQKFCLIAQDRPGSPAPPADAPCPSVPTA